MGLINAGNPTKTFEKRRIYGTCLPEVLTTLSSFRDGVCAGELTCQLAAARTAVLCVMRV